MATRSTKQCCECKKVFLREELIDYAGPAANTTKTYCKKCLEEKQGRDQFSIKVCQIFGLKKPGPRIWTERKRLRETYGYTDDIIVNCLDYIYNIEHKKKLAESLCLITPMLVDKMLKWRRNTSTKASMIAAAYQTKINEQIVPIKENIPSKKENWNPDEWLD